MEKLRNLGLNYRGLDQSDLREQIDADLLRFDMDTPVAACLLELRERLQSFSLLTTPLAAPRSTRPFQLALRIDDPALVSQSLR